MTYYGKRRYQTVRKPPSYSPTQIPELRRKCDRCGKQMTWSVLGFPQCLACKAWSFWKDIANYMHGGFIDTGYWTVVIPYSETHSTEWHPTESDGPFAVLTRGTFDTAEAAREWASERCWGSEWSVRFVAYPVD